MLTVLLIIGVFILAVLLASLIRKIIRRKRMLADVEFLDVDLVTILKHPANEAGEELIEEIKRKLREKNLLLYFKLKRLFQNIGNTVDISPGSQYSQALKEMEKSFEFVESCSVGESFKTGGNCIYSLVKEDVLVLDEHIPGLHAWLEEAKTVYQLFEKYFPFSCVPVGNTGVITFS